MNNLQKAVTVVSEYFDASPTLALPMMEQISVATEVVAALHEHDLIDGAEDDNLRTVSTEEEYEDLPVGSIVAVERVTIAMVKTHDGRWWRTDCLEYKSEELAGVTRTVLREGWGE